MLQTIKNELSAKIALILFSFFFVWWLLIFTGVFQEGTLARDLYSDLYGFMALWGGLIGLRVAKHWGGWKSVMGKAIILFSIGLLCQVFGQVVYSFYYYFLHVENPYPSIGDIGYYSTIPAYIFGVIMLAKASGIKLNVDLFKKNPLAFLLPALLLAITYKLFLEGYEFDMSSPLTVFLDFVNPFGQAIYISLALLTFILSTGSLGGIMKSKVLFLLFALLAQYLADFVFLYKTSRETWTAGGVSEFLYLLAYFLMTVGIIKVGEVFKVIRSDKL